MYLQGNEPRYCIDYEQEKLRLIFIDSYDVNESLRYGFSSLLQPARSRRRCGHIERGNVGFDVEQGRAVQHVHVLDMQNTFLDAIQLYDRKTDGIRSLGSSGGKKPVRTGIHEGHDAQLESLTAMEVVQQDDVGETFEVLQPLVIVPKHLHPTRHARGTRRLNGHALAF